jgi:hypothetical protein
VRNRLAAGISEPLADLGLGDASGLPFAIEMFEALAEETRPGLIAENKVGFGERCVVP